ncbi:MAG: hypothetical protein M1827_001986 [Pycnora praestabilis]|nr:MAG: hypothetical protein M1827_001986 [Pycnora praestabilis]
MANIKRWTVTEPYLKLDCGLGEAPYYEEESHQLRFVDILKKKVHLIDLKKGPQSHVVLGDLDIPIGCTADIEGTTDDIIIGGKTGFAIFNRTTGTYKYLNKVWEEKDGPEKDRRMRFNDGAVDSHGRFWAGAMNDPEHAEITNEGVLFRLDPDLKLHRMIEDCTIPNGIGWRADDKVMYWTDSGAGNIFAFDFDAASGSISNRRIFYHHEGDGAPDGFDIDDEGYLWTAVYGNSQVLRISPEGKVVGEISLPTRSISCPCFVGDNLFITTGAEQEPEKYPEAAKLAGSLFCVKVGSRGLPNHRFKYHGQ